MRLMLVPKSASAMHFSSSGKSQGMRNFPGSPSFLGSFLRRTAEQFSVRETCPEVPPYLASRDKEWEANKDSA
ncbi:hypothetical protein Tco_1217627 [Tanacetum coccineum]